MLADSHRTDRLTYSFRELCLMLLTTPWAFFFMGFVFGNFYLDYRYFEYLPSTDSPPPNPSRSQPQWQYSGFISTTSSGFVTFSRVLPSWPGWPPVGLPDFLRLFLGFFFRPSDDGGLLLLLLFLLSWDSNSVTLALSASIRYYQ